MLYVAWMLLISSFWIKLRSLENEIWLITCVVTRNWYMREVALDRTYYDIFVDIVTKVFKLGLKRHGCKFLTMF